MVKVGSLFICDRCGKEYFYENNWQCINPEYVNGWITHKPGGSLDEIKDLCPDCAKTFSSLIRRFYGINEEV